MGQEVRDSERTIQGMELRVHASRSSRFRDPAECAGGLGKDGEYFVITDGHGGERSVTCRRRDGVPVPPAVTTTPVQGPGLAFQDLGAGILGFKVWDWCLGSGVWG
jgi:hypothetical protein